MKIRTLYPGMFVEATEIYNNGLSFLPTNTTKYKEILEKTPIKMPNNIGYIKKYKVHDITFYNTVHTFSDSDQNA